MDGRRVVCAQEWFIHPVVKLVDYSGSHPHYPVHTVPEDSRITAEDDGWRAIEEVHRSIRSNGQVEGQL